MKKTHLLLLSLLSGLLFTIAWPVKGFTPILFIAFVPLLIIEDHILKARLNKDRFNRMSVFFYSYIAFFIWNFLSTWWIYNSTALGAALAIILNSFFMAVVFSLFHTTRMKLKGDFAGYFSLIVYWIAFEYIHQQWELSWPWLNLGNGFATWYKCIQWYEFTGIFGGTFWILAVNILFFSFFKKIIEKVSIKQILIYAGIIILLIAIPIIISKKIYNKYSEVEDPVNVLVVQPNLDPYYEQYELTPDEVLNRIMTLVGQKVDSTTDFVVCPESALQERPLYEDEIVYSRSYSKINEFLEKYPDLTFIIGASTYKIFKEGDSLTHTARKFHDAEKYYDAYNTAMMFNSDGEFSLYHKSKLTPGVEIMPYAKYMKFMENMAIDLGGTIGSLGTDAERIPFYIPEKSLKVAPIICYESVYGEFCAKFIRNGANMIFVITNDGWWGDTPGHRQHLTYSTLRAIETRRCVARSANTGISAFFNQRGDMSRPTKYWVRATIQQNINSNSEITFYARYGDYIARISIFLSIALLLITITSAIINRRKIKKLK